MSFMNRVYVGSAILVLSAGTAAATPTVSFTNVTQASPADYQNLWDDFMPYASSLIFTEDFAGAATPGRPSGGPVPGNVPAGEWDPTTVTPVGTFESAGGTGTGQSVTGTGEALKALQVRSGNNYGRFNPLTNPDALTDAQLATDGITANTNFLDSNDTKGIIWTITAADFARSVRSLQAFVTDPNDAGKRLTLSFFKDDEEIFEQKVEGSVKDGSVWHFTAGGLQLFDWDNLTVAFEKNGTGDGIGLSNVAVAVVPLPAGVLMLGLGLGGLVGLRRFRARPAA